MQGNEKKELEVKRDRLNDLNKLLEMPEFKSIFLEHFLKTTLYDVMYREGSSDGVNKLIDARKGFNDFVYDIIDEGKQAQETLKGN